MPSAEQASSSQATDEMFDVPGEKKSDTLVSKRKTTERLLTLYSSEQRSFTSLFSAAVR